MQFSNRRAAGAMLAQKLGAWAGSLDLVVLGLPRGGVPVAFEIAQALRAPLDVFVVRKLGVPGQEELALGAIASGGVRVFNQEILGAMHIPAEVIERITLREQQELERRERAYRLGRAAPDVAGKTVILVDDGIATGSTMRAAVEAVRELGAGRVIVATPTISRSTALDLRSNVDGLVALLTPDQFVGVGQWYEDFSQTTDEEVQDLLASSTLEPWSTS